MVDPNVQFTNLAGSFGYRQDGNLIPESASSAPKVAIVGTAGKGRGHRVYNMPSTSDAKAEFGIEGTLYRGMWEAKAAGALEFKLYRIGSKPAILEGVGNNGGTGGYKITTYQEDADAGGNYALYYDDSANRLVVKRNSDDLIVYDNNTSAPIDLGEVIVSGYRASVGGPDIGSPSAYVNLESVDSSTYAGTTYTAGVDGIDLSRMEMWEELYRAYEDLKTTSADVVLPMNVFLDDKNVVAQGHYDGAITPESNGTNVYPTAGLNLPGTDVDSLGMVYVEEYEGRYYFWWRFSTSGATADIWPASVGSASATAKIDGTALIASDFHEVNFAYQLARFLYEYSVNIGDATGVIGVLPPASDDLTDKARWYGKAPTPTLDTSTNLYYIASSSDNGSGLLGNKFMAGRSDWRSGYWGGGLIATESKYLDDGTEILDENDIPVDLGKYISIPIDWPLLRNSSSTSSYITTFASTYGGFYINREANSSPTNKVVPNVSIVYRIGLTPTDALAGAGYVALRTTDQGTKVADAPTAALSNSDWTRLTTMRIGKAVIDGVRSATDPYLGEGFDDSAKAALTNAIDKVLLDAKKAKYLKDYKSFEVYQTPSMAVLGKATVVLTLTPAFELRQVTFTIALSKS